MEPVIRIVCFLLLCVCLSTADVPGIIAGILLLTLVYAKAGFIHLRAAAVLFRRARWLFLSILILYIFFTPGYPVPESSIFDDYGLVSGLMPGLMLGMERVLTLSLMIMGVNILLCSTPMDRLVAGIYYLLKPLEWLGISVDRIAIRVSLVLSAVTELQGNIGQHLSATNRGVHRLKVISETAESLYRHVLDRAANSPCVPVVIEEGRHPPVYQWIYPVLIFSIFRLVLVF